MGSWHATCGVSHTPIQNGNEARLIMLAQTPARARLSGSAGGLTHCTDAWAPISLAMKGGYSGQGHLEGIDETSGDVRILLESLRSQISPTEAGKNHAHDIPCMADDLIDMRAVQRMALTGGGRLYIKTSQRYAPDERLQVGFMLVHESIYQALVGEHWEYCELASMPTRRKAAAAVCEMLRNADNPMLIDRWDFPEDNPLDAYFAPGDAGIQQFGINIGARCLIKALSADLTASDDPSPDALPLLEPMLEFARFHEAFALSGRHYAPQAAASFDLDWGLHRLIAKSVERMAVADLDDA